MSDWFVYACPKCHALVGGWNYNAPARCPTCGTMNIVEGNSQWETES
jgi:DNA-directed RNA polymerase subunit RPC12/RpoP